jgi:hypothetical protein
MKINKILSIFAIGLTIASCSNLESINDNPNSAAEVNPQAILPNICQDAFDRGYTGGMYAQKMVIQTDGQNAEQFFEWNRGDFSTYNTSLLQVEKMEEEAKRTGDSIYVPLAKFFRSYYFYNLTLTFGDIPYSAALQGQTGSNYAPKYDTQQAVFAGILQDLTDADTELKNEAGSTISGDIIYNGDVTSWRKLINSFHLKVLMTLSHHTTVGSHNIIQEFNAVMQNPLMTSNSDNGQLTFIDQAGCRYPQFNAQWSGYYMDKTYIDRMSNRKDPRLFLFALPTNEANTEGKAVSDFTAYAGGDPTVPYGQNIVLVGQGKISQINDRFRTEPTCEPTMLMGYAELQQVLAEAVVRGWITGNAQTYYENGVNASFLFYQTYATNYSQYVTPAAAATYLQGDSVKFSNDFSNDEKLKRIIFQKYCVDFYQGGWDAYFDDLRTGYPSFAHVAGTAIPYRWMYPQSEYQNNAANVTAAVTGQFGANNDNINEEPWWLKNN